MIKNQLEIEVKFFLDYPETIHSALMTLGAKAAPKIFESNLCLDTPDQTIYHSGGVLRLRQDSANHLTLKYKPEFVDSDVKVYQELEIEISDLNTLEQIFGYLGFNPTIRYEKWRQVYQYNKATCFLDTLPFGEFLEIEGEKDTIRKAAEELGLKWEKRIIKNYLAIFNVLKEKEDLKFTDPTFENFKATAATIQPYLELIEFSGSDPNRA